MIRKPYSKIGELSRQLLGIAAALSAGLLLAVPTALADGAIALGVPSDVAKEGLAFGRSWNIPDVEDAKKRALEECRNVDGAPASTRKLCKIVATYTNRCAAVALDNGSGTPGWGYAIADTKEEAEAQALQNCKRTAGKDRQKYCELGNTRCDGAPQAKRREYEGRTGGGGGTGASSIQNE